jgi:acetyl esterase
MSVRSISESSLPGALISRPASDAIRHTSCVTLVSDFPADVAELRQMLIADPPPAYATTPVNDVRAFFAERNRLVRERWEPMLPHIHTEDVAANGTLPGYRVYQPDEPAATTLIWYHGGGWVFGDVTAADPVVREIVRATGWRAISVEYRRAPEHPFPAAFDDSLAAFDALATDRIVVGGDSAGGNLAAAVANVRAQHIAGQLLIYPCVDPHLSSPSAHHYTEGPFLKRSEMEWFYGQYLDGQLDDPRVNLTGLTGIGWGPTVVWTVGHDPLRDEAIDFAARLSANDVDLQHLHAPDLFHGCVGIAGVLPSVQERLQPVWAAARAMLR